MMDLGVKDGLAPYGGTRHEMLVHFPHRPPKPVIEFFDKGTKALTINFAAGTIKCHIKMDKAAKVFIGHCAEILKLPGWKIKSPTA